MTLNQLDFESLPKSHHRRLQTFELPLEQQHLPKSLDFRETGLVGPVHQQGRCNSCWAFAAAGSLEYWLRKEKPRAEVSVRDILECSPHTYKCMGGLMEDVFQYEGFFSLGYDYSEKYTTKCKHSPTGVRAKGYQVLTVHPEKYLSYMLNTWGPVAVAVDFSKQFHYKGGVIKATDCNDKPDHAVLAVGYTPNFWIVKNSHGTTWGDSGYAYIERGKNACGIDTYAAVATGIFESSK
jgi:C1A family cysteine protease